MTEDGLIIRDVNLIDGTGQGVKQRVDILLRGTIIEAIRPTGTLSGLSVCHEVPAGGYTVIPGLIDVHGHYEDWMGELLINHGITSMVDTGNLYPLRWLKIQQQGIDSGDILGPRLFSFGSPITGEPVPPAFRSSGYPVVGDANEARSAVDELQCEFGVDGVKAYINLSEECLAALTSEAHSRGLPVMAHTNMDARRAAELGVDALAHATGVKYAALSRQELVPIQADAPYASAPSSIIAWGWADSRRLRSVADSLSRAGIYLEPDLIHTGGKAASEYASSFNSYNNILFNDPRLSYIPESFRAQILHDEWWGQQSPDQVDAARRGFDALREFVHSFYSAGGTVLAASGMSVVPPGISLHRELQLLVSAGLPPEKALQGATRHAAEYLRRWDELGSVEEGKIADLLVLRADPLMDITNTQGIVEVIKSGKRMPLGYHPWYSNPIPAPPPSWLAHGYPRPRIDSVDPGVIRPGEQSRLTVTGDGFAPLSKVRLGARYLPTEFIHSQKLETVLQRYPGAGTYKVSVCNPQPAPMGQESDPTYVFCAFD